MGTNLTSKPIFPRRCTPLWLFALWLLWLVVPWNLMLLAQPMRVGNAPATHNAITHAEIVTAANGITTKGTKPARTEERPTCADWNLPIKQIYEKQRKIFPTLNLVDS